MLNWILQNLGTIIVAIAVATIITLIIVFRVRAKKKGVSSCGCNCKNCASYGVCHSKIKDNTSK